MLNIVRVHYTNRRIHEATKSKRRVVAFPAPAQERELRGPKRWNRNGLFDIPAGSEWNLDVEEGVAHPLAWKACIGRCLSS